jgi:hypothetical protein
LILKKKSISYFFIFSDFLSYPDSTTSIIPDNHSMIRPTIVRRNKRLNKYQSTVFETKKRLFNSSKKLKEELGVKIKFKKKNPI